MMTSYFNVTVGEVQIVSFCFTVFWLARWNEFRFA